MFGVSFRWIYCQAALHLARSGTLVNDSYFGRWEMCVETNRNRLLRESRSTTISFGLSPESDWPQQLARGNRRCRAGTGDWYVLLKLLESKARKGGLEDQQTVQSTHKHTEKKRQILLACRWNKKKGWPKWSEWGGGHPP